MRGEDPIEPFRRHNEEPFSGAQITAFQSVIFSLPIPFLPSERLSWTQGVRRTIGNEGKVFRGDQGMEVKQGKWKTPN
jgi:hypothetical protein